MSLTSNFDLTQLSLATCIDCVW